MSTTTEFDGAQVLDWNAGVIKEFRENGGVVGGQFAGMSLILLTTTGAKSGQQRVSPLAHTMDGDHVVICASKAGAPTNPDWYHNLVAHPEVTVEYGTEKFQARARVAEGTERERLYNQMASEMPGFAGYQKNTTRVIPVVVLERLP